MIYLIEYYLIKLSYILSVITTTAIYNYFWYFTCVIIIHFTFCIFTFVISV